MKLNFKKLLPVCLLCLLFPISRVSAGKPEIFTPEQCQAIIQYVADHGGPGVFNKWERLKRELHLPQTAKQIREKYTFSLNPRINRGKWTAAEDQAILDGFGEYGNQWALIAEKMGTERTEMQVRQRFMRALDPNLIKGPFTDEEDQKIRDWVAKNGPGNWGKCANGPFGGTRYGKQLRERWTNHLNPNLNNAPWSTEEDQLIIQQVKTRGKKWVDIAKLLPGRSDNAIANRWHNYIKKMILDGAPPEVQADRTAQLLDTPAATSGNDDFSFTPVESTVGSPLFDPPPISPLQSPIDWSFLNSTQNSSVAPPAPVPDGSGNNSLPNLNLSAQNPPTVPTQQATSGNGDFMTDFSFTPVESTVGSPLFDPPPISPWQSPIDWSFLNSTPNSSVAQPASVSDGSGNNSPPNLNSSAQNPPTVPTRPATSGNGDFMTDFSFTPVDNNTNNNDFTLFSFESPLEQALNDNLGLPGSFDYFDFSEFK